MSTKKKRFYVTGTRSLSSEAEILLSLMVANANTTWVHRLASMSSGPNVIKLFTDVIYECS
jgi:hypothetical protein